MAGRSLLGAHTRVLTHIPAGHRASAGCRQAADAPAHGHPHRSAWRCRRERRRPYCWGRVGASLRPPRGPSCSRTRLRCAMQAEALPSRPVVASRARVARASRGAHGGRARWGARWGPGKAVHGCRLDTCHWASACRLEVVWRLRHLLPGVTMPTAAILTLAKGALPAPSACGAARPAASRSR